MYSVYSSKGTRVYWKSLSHPSSSPFRKQCYWLPIYPFRDFMPVKLVYECTFFLKRQVIAFLCTLFCTFLFHLICCGDYTFSEHTDLPTLLFFKIGIIQIPQNLPLWKKVYSPLVFNISRRLCNCQCSLIQEGLEDLVWILALAFTDLSHLRMCSWKSRYVTVPLFSLMVGVFEGLVIYRKALHKL